MKRIVLIAALLVLAAACASGDDSQASSPDSTDAAPAASTDPAPAASTDPAPDVTVLAPMAGVSLHVTSPAGDRSGNRVVAGRADLAADPIVVVLATAPLWVVGSPVGDRIVWVVADTDGGVTAYAEANGEATEFPLGDVALPPGAPPLVLVGGTAVSVFQPTGASPLAGHTVAADVAHTISPNGTVFVGDEPVPGVTALPDGRIVVSARGEAAFLAGPTDQLAHGILGDRIESEAVVVLERGTTSVQAVLEAPDGTVFEAIAPLWADVDGDGIDDILVTASDVQNGARLVVYSADGDLIGQSAPIGTGSRWLNQLAAAPVGPRGEIEVMEVRTPHIGGIVRWYRLVGDTLELQAAAERYSTHTIGSRNLDQGLVIDANGDGELDVVVPTQDQETIVALGRTTDGAEITLSIPLGARLATNLSGVTRTNGSASLALATADGRLLIWP